MPRSGARRPGLGLFVAALALTAGYVAVGVTLLVTADDGTLGGPAELALLGVYALLLLQAGVVIAYAVRVLTVTHGWVRRAAWLVVLWLLMPLSGLAFSVVEDGVLGPRARTTSAPGSSS